MDDVVLASIARWPNVPDVYGWLGLDRRGQWRLQGSPITNPHITEFIGRNYQCDKRGAWYFQNGPQRVYVALDCAPWVLRIGNDGALLTHTGAAVTTPREALLDEQGNLLIQFEHGLGLIDDRDLSALLENVVDSEGATADEAALMALMNGDSHSLGLRWQGTLLPLAPIAADALPTQGGFIAAPCAAPD